MSYLALKAHKPWGKRALVVCLVLIVCLCLGRLLFGGSRGPGTGIVARELNTLEAQETKRAKLIGEGLRGKVPAASRIFFLGSFPTDMRQDWDVIWPAWQKGLSGGLGHSDWQLLDYFGPVQGSAAEALSGALAAKKKEVDVIVSFNGLPQDFAQMSTYQFENEKGEKIEKRPKVGAYFPPGADVEAIRRWLQDDIIQAAVVDENGKLDLYTRDKMP